MALTFSIAKPEQAEVITQFVNAAYRGDSSREGWTTEAELLDGQRTDPRMILDLLQKPDQVFLVAYEVEQEHRIVGCVHLEKGEGGTCYLGMLAVKPTLQNQGIGAQLLAETESWARSWNCTSVTLGVLAPRRELIDWYTRHQYRVTGEKKDFPYGDLRFGSPIRKDLHFLVMKKEL
jgi:GNAT superfamily N-acetyltransferase